MKKTLVPLIILVVTAVVFTGISARVTAAVVSIPAMADTFVTQHMSFNGTSSIHGNDAVLEIIGAPPWQCTPLVAFDLSSFTGQSVVGNATLSMYVMQSGSYTKATQVIGVCTELNNWTEAGTSWKSLPGPSGTTGPTLDTQTITYNVASNPARYVNWTIPGSVVQSWIDNSTTNYGLALVSSTTPCFQDLAFSSREGGFTPLLNFTTSLTPATYDLTAAATAGIIHLGETTSVTATITNRGGTDEPDSLNYVGLSLTPSGGLLGAGLPKDGGPLAPGASDTGTQTFSPGAAGTYAFTPTVTSVVNVSAGPAVAGARVGAVVDVFSGSAKWTSNSGTDWNSSGNWRDTAAAVHAAPGTFAGFDADTAIFDGSGAASTVNLNWPVTLHVLALGTNGDVSGYTFVGNNSLTLTNGSVVISSGNHTISAPVVLAGNLSVDVWAGSSLCLSGGLGQSTSSSLTVVGAGILTLEGAITYTGGTSITGCTLQGDAANLPGNITNNGVVMFNQMSSGTYAGVMAGSGGIIKTGTARLTLAGADSCSSSGGISVNQGTLTAPLGIPHAGSSVHVASGAMFEAGGQVNRAVIGNGTITATNDLIIGSSQRTGQFNQGGAPGVGGVLNVGSNAVAIFSADTAILGSQTNLDAGGSLSTLSGAQLGNAASLDITKTLTASGSATINGNFINNGVVNGPTGAGERLTFTQFVKGAGSTTGNIQYVGCYSPGNSAAAVSIENLLLASTSTLIMEVGGVTPDSEYDRLDISGQATLNGTLRVNLLDGFTPSSGQVFVLFSGDTEGCFSQIGLPALGGDLNWDTSGLYTTGEIRVVPEPSTSVLLGGAAVLFAWVSRRRRAE